MNGTITVRVEQCSAGSRSRAASMWWIGSVVSASVTVAPLVAMSEMTRGGGPSDPGTGPRPVAAFCSSVSSQVSLLWTV